MSLSLTSKGPEPSSTLRETAWWLTRISLTLCGRQWYKMQARMGTFSKGKWLSGVNLQNFSKIRLNSSGSLLYIILVGRTIPWCHFFGLAHLMICGRIKHLPNAQIYSTDICWGPVIQVLGHFSKLSSDWNSSDSALKRKPLEASSWSPRGEKRVW